MPISVSCGGCGKKMKAPDSFAGKRVKSVRGRALTGRIVLTRLPRHRSFTLKVVARTTKGKKLTTRHRYRNC